MQTVNTNKEIKNEIGQKYGPLLTTDQVAKIFHRTTQSLRSDLSGSSHSEFANELIKARKYIGRRVYFKAVDIEKIIEEM